MEPAAGATGGQRASAGADAPTRVAVVDSDLFFGVKVGDTLKLAGYAVRVSRGDADFARSLALQDERPRVALVNTAARGIDYQRIIALARAAHIPIVAYGAHVDLETQARARAAGATRVISNARLAADLPGIIARIVKSDAADGPA